MGSNTEDLQTEINQLEALCRAFYLGSPDEQRHAHNILLPLSSDVRHVTQLQQVLAQSNDLHALIFSANALTKLMSANWINVADTEKESLKKFLLTYLFQRGPDLVTNANIVLQVFSRLLVRIIKLSWLENVGSQSITDQVNEFLQASTPHWIVGLTIYTELTSDMQPQLGTQISKQRRTAISFKDSVLPTITKVGVQTLQQINSGAVRSADRNEEHQLLHKVLSLVNNCLSFDFMGIVPDDTTDEQFTIMIPLSWSFLKDAKICDTFFELYMKCWSHPPLPDCARLCLQCLVLVSAFRRSFFTKEEDRQSQISQLIKGTASVLQGQIGLCDDSCYHEFCRLLGKINAANQFRELSASTAFNTWIDEVFKFTLKALENWTHLPCSKHYLLGVWSGMLSSHDRKNALVDRYLSQVTVAYVESRMRVAEALASGNDSALDMENPLENDVLRTEQLEALAYLARCRYTQTCTYVGDLFERTNQDAISGVINDVVFQQKSAWLIYMIGSLIGGYTLMFSFTKPSTSILRDVDDTISDDSDSGTMNSNTQTLPAVVIGDLAAKVFKLMIQTDNFAMAPELLEMAYLSFLDEFRKYLIFAPNGPRSLSYLSVDYTESVESDQTATKRICEVLGLQSEDDVMGLLIRKIFFNLQKRVNCEKVLEKTLQLLMLCCSGLSVIQSADRLPHLVICGKIMLNDPTVRHVMMNHCSSNLVFLTIPKYSRYRTTYYNSMARLLFLDLKMDENRSPSIEHVDESAFVKFMEPMKQIMDGFAYVEGVTSTASGRESAGTISLHDPNWKFTLIGLFRDLRGICAACMSPDSYILLFNWLVNRPKQPGHSRIHLFKAAVDARWSDHEVIVPLLKFVSEFVYNRAGRISFEQSSANGVLLFKEASTIFVSYGQRILTKYVNGDDAVKQSDISNASLSTHLYREKYKGIAIALELFSHTLVGNYTNFGVFEFYNDPALANSLSLALEMCLAIPNEDLQAFLKTLKPVYGFLEVVTLNFMPQVLALQSNQLASVIRSIEDGLCALETGVSMQCCSALDCVIKYLYEQQYSENEAGEVVRRFLQEQPHVLKRILQVIFQLVVSGEAKSTWSLSRPLLGLVLLLKDEYLTIKNHIIEMQPSPEKKAKYAQHFSDLMSEIACNLSIKNRDQFTKNLFQFSHAIRTTTASKA